MSTINRACRDRDGRDRDPRGTTALFQLELYRHKEWHSKNLQSRVCMHSRQYFSAPAPPRVAPSGLRGVGCRTCVVVSAPGPSGRGVPALRSRPDIPRRAERELKTARSLPDVYRGRAGAPPILDADHHAIGSTIMRRDGWCRCPRRSGTSNRLAHQHADLGVVPHQAPTTLALARDGLRALPLLRGEALSLALSGECLSDDVSV